jgi:NDP-sugar pyrophosphorylase family protein
MREVETMLNIVIPMAGRGSRFQEAGFQLPKPLVPVHGQPMIEVVIENMRPRREHRFIFLCLKEHLDQYEIDRRLKQWAPGCEVLVVDSVTEGAACTVLLARQLIDSEAPLMIGNSDQWVDIDINDYLGVMASEDAEGLIMTMWADHPKWSYIRFDSEGVPCEVVEKQVVSNEATVGIYNYRHGADFVTAAERMIAKNLRVNNEFYVAPVYNEMIARGSKIAYYNVGREYDGMYGMGIPSDLERFERLPVSRKAVAQIYVREAWPSVPLTTAAAVTGGR